MTVNEVLPVVLYFLGAILLVCLIVLTIKLIIVVNKTEKVVDNITVKVKTLDELFNVIGAVTGKFTLVTEKIVDGIALLIEKIFRRKGDK
ncbi:MAG: hypothetical protein IJZ46_01275 [Bacilli bacterium]|nr:hypothetical protein [Bacilli bacterium]